MYKGYKNKLARKLYMRNWRKENRKRVYDLHRQWLKKTGKKYNRSGRLYFRTKPYSNYFKNASPISKKSLYRHGLNAIKIYEKYQKKCVYCSQDWDLTIHHLDNQGRNYIEKGLKPNNIFNNLILICRKCHGSIHGKQGGRPIES